MHTFGLSRRYDRLIRGVALAALLLPGCRGDKSETVGPERPSSSAAPGSTPSSGATTKPAAQAGSLPIPAGGPTTITEFPIPGGAKIVDGGPALGGNWQFGISSPGPAAVLQFYRTTLAAKGYTLEEKRKVQAGKNTVEYDQSFSGPGPIYVLVDENPLAGGTSITVTNRPITGF